MLRFLFPISLFLSALLLFSIQPMVAKALLPVYGGTPAVWIVCMLFFQLLLLIAYGYVWLLSFFKNPNSWRLVHGLLLILSITIFPLVFLPVGLEGQPEWGILYSLLTQAGLPLLIIGASAPLLQFAYSQTSGKGAADPYFLYIASNLGSLLALLIYPWVIERFIGLNAQFYLWNIIYLIYLLSLITILLMGRYKPLVVEDAAKIAWPWRDMLYWVFLSFIPCSLMLGVTLYITTDVAATPLFWVLPLALYLLSFIVTFTTKPLISQAWVTRNYLLFLVFTILGFILGVNNILAWQLVVINLLSFFILAVLCHGQLFLRRPKPQLLTLFYFCLAIGGVLAGFFNGIIAPHLFNQVYEYPIAILLSVLIVPLTHKKGGMWPSLLIAFLLLMYFLMPVINGFPLFKPVAITVLIIIVLSRQSNLNLFFSLLLLFALLFLPIFKLNQVLLQKRNFYGVKQVQNVGNTHVLISQSTLHGIQFTDEKKPISGLRSYYGAPQVVVDALKKDFPSMPVTIIGLGTGTLICQFREQDQVKVIEIDQQVIDIAKDPKLFTYLRDCLPKVEVIKNDGRLALAKIADNSQKLLILDAFNSDAIPVHLMTLDAFKVYKNKISSDGSILINVSNRHLELAPVLNAIGHALGMQVYYLLDNGNRALGQFPSKWVLLSANPSWSLKLKDSKWQLVDKKDQLLWTDDYSNIVPLMHWF